MRFSDFIGVQVGEVNKNFSDPATVLYYSLLLHTNSGKLGYKYLIEMADAFQQAPGEPQFGGLDYRHELYLCLAAATQLFIVANQGNQIDEENIEHYLSWNAGRRDLARPEILLKLCSQVNTNLRNISAGILERSGFYPIFGILADFAGSIGTTLADIAEEFAGPVA